MAATYRSRFLQINQVVFDWVDVFQSDFFSRVTGLTPGDIGFQIYRDNTPVSWNLVDGTGVQDSQVTAGSVYWNELPSGAYGVRFFPQQLGHWTLVFSFTPSPAQVTNLSFDIVNLPNVVDTGVVARFC